MARYIDADVLHIQMEDLYEHHLEMHNFSADGAVADCLDLLDNAPTADVVEVVRCKDCKHGDVSIIQRTKDGKETVACYCELSKSVTDVDSYCSCGEKRGATDDKQ